MATAEYLGKLSSTAEKAKAPSLDDQVRETLDRAIAWLLKDQDGDGWWCGELEANVTIQAEYILLMQFLGLRDDARWVEVVRYIQLRQQEDGGWPVRWRQWAPGTSLEARPMVTIEALYTLRAHGRPIG